MANRAESPSNMASRLRSRATAPPVEVDAATEQSSPGEMPSPVETLRELLLSHGILEIDANAFYEDCHRGLFTLEDFHRKLYFHWLSAKGLVSEKWRFVALCDLVYKLVRDESEQRKSIRVESELKIPQLEKILASIDKLSLQVSSRTGGEPSSRTDGQSSSRTGEQSPSILFQERGREATQCPVSSSAFPLVQQKFTRKLWDQNTWESIVGDEQSEQTEGKSKKQSPEEKFKKLLVALEEEQLDEKVDFTFVKCQKKDMLTDPKVADFYLVRRDQKSYPTPENIAGILFTQSTSATKSYCTLFAVGEAVSVGQVFLRTADESRQYVMVGVTNLYKIKWYQVMRPGPNGEFHGYQSLESADVRGNLAAFMFSKPWSLGINTRPFFRWHGKARACGKWLGEGLTSSVYLADIEGEQYAVKLAKKGFTLEVDHQWLTALKGIPGIPAIHSNANAKVSPKYIIMKPVCQKFTAETAYLRGMEKDLGQLVDILQHAHKMNIVNRDVRISNIMICEKQFYIVDWGFAAHSDKIASFAGTTHYASDGVLLKLKAERTYFAPECTDDLVSLVRSLYGIWHPDRVAKELELLDARAYDDILSFWNEEMDRCNYWMQAQVLAQKGDYMHLKEWIFQWILNVGLHLRIK